MATGASARYIPHDTPRATFSTNPDKTTNGRRNSSLPATYFCGSPLADMSDGRNPNAAPFRPDGDYDGRRDHFSNGFENQLPAPPPFTPGAPWNASYAPPPFFNNMQAPNHYAPQAHVHANHDQWAPQYNHPGYHPGFPPYGMPPYGPQSHHGLPPAFGQQTRQDFQNRAYYHTNMHSQANVHYGANNGDIQYAFDALIKGLQSRKGHANAHARMNTPSAQVPSHRAFASSQFQQKEYASLQRAAPHATVSSRINKHRSTPRPSKNSAIGRYGDAKIMLPAPQPTPEYLAQAAEEPSVTESPNPMLVILDLNGTVLYRPNRNAKTMIERPFLKPFLRYLFENFKVMVWSSAKPDNVRSLVHQALDNDLRSKLIAHWGRDSFGLSVANYNQNVQVYKNLKLIWSRDQIQRYHPEYATGARFGQHNTVLIDDCIIKASAQPHNLLQIPDFSATPEQMEGDVLREVAGYLEVLRQQSDVSKFISKEPFQDVGRWTYDWPDAPAAGGEMSKASKKKNKKKQKKASGKASPTTNRADQTPTTEEPKTEVSATPVLETTASSPATLPASVLKDW